MSVTGPGGDLNSAAGLYGPGSHSYVSDAYGYSYSSEDAYGHFYTHTAYHYGGAYTDYHAYAYTGQSYSYNRETVYRSFDTVDQAYASGYGAPPSSAAYGYLTNLYESRSLSDTAYGAYTYQNRSTTAYEHFASGYSTSYVDYGSSEFDNGSFISGTATNYSLSTVTNPYGYSTYTPNYKSY